MGTEERELCPICRTELEHIIINEEDVFGCHKCKKEISREDSIKAKKCKVINNFCEFALSNGECSQPSLSVNYLKCLERAKNNKSLTLKDLRVIYDLTHAQPGDTDLDFYYWVVDRLLSERNKIKLLKQEINRHLTSIGKAIEKLEEQEFCGVCGRELSIREAHTKAIKDTPDNSCNICRKENKK
jgi:DNA-binding transcriptional MerR regulator